MTFEYCIVQVRIYYIHRLYGYFVFKVVLKRYSFVFSSTKIMVFVKAYSNRCGNALSAVKTHCPLFKAYYDGRRRNEKCRPYSTNTTGVLPKSCKVAICGGGVMGASVAYHLAQLGWGPQTIVIEQDKYITTVVFLSADVFNVFIFTLYSIHKGRGRRDFFFVGPGRRVQTYVESSQTVPVERKTLPRTRIARLSNRLETMR